MKITEAKQAISNILVDTYFIDEIKLFVKLQVLKFLKALRSEL